MIYGGNIMKDVWVNAIQTGYRDYEEAVKAKQKRKRLLFYLVGASSAIAALYNLFIGII